MQTASGGADLNPISPDLLTSSSEVSIPSEVGASGLRTWGCSLVCSWPRVQQTPSTVWGLCAGNLRVKEISKNLTELIYTSFKKSASDPARPRTRPDVTFTDHGSDGGRPEGSTITQHVRHIAESTSSLSHEVKSFSACASWAVDGDSHVVLIVLAHRASAHYRTVLL